MTYVAQHLPYIGVTGITQLHEIQTVTDKWLNGIIEWPENRLFMNGILVSSRSLSGEEPSNPKQYTRIERVAELMPADSRIFSVVHFNISGLAQDPDLANGLYGYLQEICSQIPGVEGIQLNMAWPDPYPLQRFRDCAPVELILQVSDAAYRECGSPQVLVERMRPYAGIVDRLLLDPSGGNGLSFDVELSRRQLSALAEADLGIDLGLAGGLSGNSMGSLRQLLSDFPDLSWDAQRLLRDAEDELDLAKAYEFVWHSAQLVLHRQQASVRAGSS